MQLVHDSLVQTARHTPDHPALVCDDRTLTFARLDAACDRVATELQRCGVVRGDRVAILMENSAELAIALFSVLKAGAVFVVINPTTKAKKLAFILNDCGARVLLAQPTLSRVVADAVSAVPSLATIIWTDAPSDNAPRGRTFQQVLCEAVGGPRDPGLIDIDLAAIIYTSGTTGEPKGVMLTHQNIVATTRSIVQYLGNDASDVVCCVLPLAFSYGLYQLFAMALAGYTLVLEKSFAFPIELLRTIERHHVTGLPGVPGIFAAIIQVAPACGINLSSLRYMTNAAGPMPTAHVLRILELFPAVRFFSMYGQTECARACFMPPERLARKPASVGGAIPNTELYLVDEQGERVGAHVVGELVVRGANVMRGYWGRPEATAQKLRPGPISGETVLHTGDLFRADEDGDLYFVSRTDDLIKCKGEKVAPKEVEDAICLLEGVAEAAVVGVEDPIDGKAIKAFVTPRTGYVLTEQEIRKHCRANLENYMVPKFVTICDALPKTDSGKIRKRGLAPPQAEGIQPNEHSVATDVGS